jgi:hypothetical protein
MASAQGAGPFTEGTIAIENFRGAIPGLLADGYQRGPHDWVLVRVEIFYQVL